MVEEAEYTVVRTLGNLEIRRYAPMILASVKGLSDNEAFGILFRYITGNNKSRKDIAMTTPVVSEQDSSEEIAMTAPVVTDRQTFSFVLPSGYSMETAPIPLDQRINIVEIRPRHVAVIRFRGRASSSQVQKKTEEMLTTLGENGLNPRGRPFLMRYNPPFTPGFLRRNEVGTEIE